MLISGFRDCGANPPCFVNLCIKWHSQQVSMTLKIIKRNHLFLLCQFICFTDRQTELLFGFLRFFFFFLVENLFLSDTALIYLDRFLGLLQVASCPNYSLPQLGWRILECPQYIAGQCLMGHS